VGPDAHFRINGRGGLADVLSLLDGPPFDIFRDGTMTPERIGTGRSTLRHGASHDTRAPRHPGHAGGDGPERAGGGHGLRLRHAGA
jgi:hypothetical protein